jgi:hypothetical protein
MEAMWVGTPLVGEAQRREERGTHMGRGAALLHGLRGAGKERRTGGAARQGRRAAGTAGGAPGTGARAGSRGWWGEEEDRRLRGGPAGEERRLDAGRW